MPNIYWFQLLRIEDFLLFLFYITVHLNYFGYGLLVEQNKTSHWALENLTNKPNESIIKLLVAAPVFTQVLIIA